MGKQHKKKAKKNAKKKHGETIAVAWYNPEQWDFLRQVAADWDSLEDTYEQWLKHAEDAVRILMNSGYNVRTVDVDVAELTAWCKKHKRPVDGEARSEFVLEKIEDRHGGEKA